MAPNIKTLALSGNAVIDGLIIAYAFADKQITYSFGYGDLNSNGIPDFEEGDWKAFYREILDGIETFADLRFVEASGRGTINFVLREGGGGESLYPYHGVESFDTVVGIHPDVPASAEIVRLGTYSQVWLHEIGHAIGLAHPHDDDGNGVLPGVTDPGSAGTGLLNSHIYTVMGYTHPFLGEDNPFTTEVDFRTPLWAQPGSFGAIDIAALQYFYGARASHTGSDIYRFSDDVDFNRGYTTIWDSGGDDTIQYVGSGRAKIDLRAATLNPEIGGGGWISTSDRLTGGYTIAHGVTIENATGAAGDDILIGNHVANLLTGGAGRDILTGGAGNDIFAGTIADLNEDRITDFAVGDVIRVLAATGTEAPVQSIAVSGDRLTVVAESTAATLVVDGLSAFAGRLAFQNGTVTIVSAPPVPPTPPLPPVPPLPPTPDSTHIPGTSGNDRIVGTTGSDIVDLSRGNDLVDGRGGVDAIFTDLDHASLTIARGSNGEIVVDFAGGSTSLFDVELLRTADGVFLLDPPAPQGFDEEFYLANNSDVAKALAAGDISSARSHYDAFGLAEGRIGAMPFDEGFYLREYPDVARAVSAGDFASARDHFVRFGNAEGRDPIPLFDSEFYLAQNSDVKQAVESGALTAYGHFLRFGSGEGRAASEFFDGDDYLAANPDVALSGIDPVAHIYGYGVAEWRDLGASLA